MKDLRTLLTVPKFAGTHFKLSGIYVGCISVYFLALFNQSMIKGDTLTIAILFGACEAMGCVLGERVIMMLPDHIAMYFSLIAIIVSTSMLKLM